MLLIFFARDLSQHPVLSGQAYNRLQLMAADVSNTWTVVDAYTSYNVAPLGKELVLTVKQSGNLVESLSQYYFEGDKLSKLSVHTLAGQYVDTVLSASELALHLLLLEKILLT